ncbi:MAG: Holliday junction resolvase RuvX, partial [Rhodospirillales bacterium]|nr:Holliday junction resolvase RuvX [Rhodospirillales bacterium]
MQRILAVDVGTVRVGVAISDPLGMTAQPLEVIERKRVDPFARLAALVEEWEVTQVVIGLPLTLEGDESYAA